VRGPLSGGELVTFFAHVGVKAGDLAWNERTATWVRADEAIAWSSADLKDAGRPDLGPPPPPVLP
jgi:hypothetical protein